MEDGGCGFARAHGCRESVFVLCLGTLVECSPFFLGCIVFR